MMNALSVGFGCFWGERWRKHGGFGSVAGAQAPALVAHSICCDGGNSSAWVATRRDFHGLYELFAQRDVEAPTAVRAERAAWGRTRAFLKADCWPAAGDDAVGELPLPLLLNRGNCCHRAFVDVDIAVVGIAKAATFSLMQLLGVHPEIVSIKHPETDALTSLESLVPNDVALHNIWARSARAGKRGGRLLAIKQPMLVYDQQKMWRLAQIPGLKVIIMLREPTEWLASLYDFFLADCLQNETARSGNAFRFSNLCCKSHTFTARFDVSCEKFPADEVPRFWEDVVGLNKTFSALDVGRVHGNFAKLLKMAIAELYALPSVAILDVGVLKGDRRDAVDVLQRLAQFLGASRPFEEQALLEELDEVFRTRGGHKEHRVSFDRVRLCGTSESDRARADALYEGERKQLERLLRDWKDGGAFVAASHELMRPPCGGIFR